MRLIALINNCKQYSPDSFEDQPNIIEIKPETTIQELLQWEKNIFYAKGEMTETNFKQIHILPLESVAKVSA